MIKIFIRFFIFVIGSGLLLLFMSRLITHLHAKSRTYSVDVVNQSPVVVVFGAGLWRDGTPTPVLRERITTAANLYFQGKVKKILMSGDNRVHDYNEPQAMLEYALDLGVPGDDIVLDHGGWRTYDTCNRLRRIFQIREVILVTQKFHLPRALYTCNSLGVKASGVPADTNVYRKRSMIYWQLRETAATINALWEIHVHPPEPNLNHQQPIINKAKDELNYGDKL